MENDIGYRTIRYINQIFEKHFFKVWYSHKNWLSYCKDMITSHMWFKSTNAIKIRTTYVMNAILTKSKKPKVVTLYTMGGERQAPRIFFKPENATQQDNAFYVRLAWQPFDFCGNFLI